MSPRSEEFMAEAERCLRGAQAQLDADLPSRAIGETYYAMLYAARAALSEQDRYAKTHRGTWASFHELLVASGRFDRALAGEGPRIQAVREGTDYEARGASADEAAAALATARRFVSAVAETLRG